MRFLRWGRALPHRGRGRAPGGAGPGEGLGAQGARLDIFFPVGSFAEPPQGLRSPPGFVPAIILRGFAPGRQAFLPSPRPLAEQ